MLKISTQFDGGNIEIVDAHTPSNIRLKLPKDNAANIRQWFYFRVQGAAYQNLQLHFINAADSAYPAGWEDYEAMCSYDRINWFRVPTTYENGILCINHTPLANSVYYAYFEPYSYEQHLNLLGDSQSSGLCQIEDLGSTIQGRDINLLTIGNQAASDLKIWIIARQHPGETMAEWFVEGVLNRLLDHQDPTARALLDRATFYIVPNMNPDGSALGNLRTNAVGANLNREWLNPSMERSPEVFVVRQKMQETGVDLFLDIHGDETIPYVFLSGNEGIPSFDERLYTLQKQFKHAFLVASPDFQDKYGYEKDAPGEANLSLATSYIGETFKCLAYTLEMPFKDNHQWPDDDFGWNGQRSLRLGEAILSPIYAILDSLR
ncbi:MAG: carboxypeptidase family protein [Snodgrassella sp.]|uniref:M14 family metallopeptidase n=1 Tax=Snodgrassella TaxID=1193515 RepID=UPI0008163276|nr:MULTISPECIES: M14-type cytosolic carboxypeptidase [Snodgrassella]MCO6506690.1 carboxypeptidase family protein [Snodgrassella sp.]MCO6518230.1 carboxypeptidase family protein [Snodgrassella sp.]MCO6522547.1 carboxypeptidase family protein [Snodgrassella sp.]MCO6525580.1 carboxypeptidase family protein [Snodgrassella sp.]SCB73187.1 Murein tripeptide amidase MpaA [Snodgrassella sp. R-53583]